MGRAKLFPGRALVGKTSGSQTKPRGREEDKAFSWQKPPDLPPPLAPDIKRPKFTTGRFDRAKTFQIKQVNFVRDKYAKSAW